MSTSCRFLPLTPCNVPTYAPETGLPENLRASRREGCPGTLLAKMGVVQDGRQADGCPVAWDVVGWSLLMKLSLLWGISFTGFLIAKQTTMGQIF